MKMQLKSTEAGMDTETALLASFATTTADDCRNGSLIVIYTL